MPDRYPDLGAFSFRRRRDAGDVLRETVRFLRHAARELGPAYLAVVAPVALAAGLSGAVFMAQSGDLLADPAAIEADPAAVFTPAYWGAVAFGLLGTALTAAAVGAYVRLYRAGFGGDVSVGALWDETRPLLMPMAGLIVAYAIGLGAATALFAIPGVGVVLWVALAAWSVPYVAVALAARAVDADSLGEAWRSARERLEGAWWGAFWTILLAVVVCYLAIGVAVLPVLVLAGAVGADLVAVAALQLVVYVGYLIPLVATFVLHGSLEARSGAETAD